MIEGDLLEGEKKVGLLEGMREWVGGKERERQWEGGRERERRSRGICWKERRESEKTERSRWVEGGREGK